MVEGVLKQDFIFLITKYFNSNKENKKLTLHRAQTLTTLLMCFSFLLFWNKSLPIINLTYMMTIFATNAPNNGLGANRKKEIDR